MTQHLMLAWVSSGCTPWQYIHAMSDLVFSDTRATYLHEPRQRAPHVLHCWLATVVVAAEVIRWALQHAQTFTLRHVESASFEEVAPATSSYPRTKGRQDKTSKSVPEQRWTRNKGHRARIICPDFPVQASRQRRLQWPFFGVSWEEALRSPPPPNFPVVTRRTGTRSAVPQLSQELEQSAKQASRPSATTGQ